MESESYDIESSSSSSSVVFEFDWEQCGWCWSWGICHFTCSKYVDLRDTDFLELALWEWRGFGLLCDGCSLLPEPPWRPNNRQRCQQYLRIMLPRNLRDNTIVTRMIAVFLARNVP